MTFIQKITRITAATVLFFTATLASADILVIVHPENSSKIDVDFIQHVYQGKVTQFPDGSTVQPAILADSPLTDYFLKKIVKQSPVQFKRLWSKALFTGKGTPPIEFSNQQDMLNYVLNDRSAIGFIDEVNYTNDVRAVVKLRMP